MEFNDALIKLEAKLKELKRDYELYFKGDLRREPINDRARMTKAITKLLTMHVANTQLKFRAQTLSNSFHANCRYWDRVVLQIEAGTYRPDIFKADMRVGRFNPDTKEVERPAFEPERQVSTKEKLAEKQMRSLHTQFVEARRVTGENTSVSFSTFKQSLNKQRPTLESKYGDRLRFKIVIEGKKVKVKGFST